MRSDLKGGEAGSGGLDAEDLARQPGGDACSPGVRETGVAGLAVGDGSILFETLIPGGRVGLKERGAAVGDLTSPDVEETLQGFVIAIHASHGLKDEVLIERGEREAIQAIREFLREDCREFIGGEEAGVGGVRESMDAEGPKPALVAAHLGHFLKGYVAMSFDEVVAVDGEERGSELQAGVKEEHAVGALGFEAVGHFKAGAEALVPAVEADGGAA